MNRRSFPKAAAASLVFYRTPDASRDRIFRNIFVSQGSQS